MCVLQICASAILYPMAFLSVGIVLTKYWYLTYCGL